MWYSYWPLYLEGFVLSTVVLFILYRMYIESGKLEYQDGFETLILCIRIGLIWPLAAGLALFLFFWLLAEELDQKLTPWINSLRRKMRKKSKYKFVCPTCGKIGKGKTYSANRFWNSTIYTCPNWHRWEVYTRKDDAK